MQLTRAADYAIRVMVHLASCAPGTRASRTELAVASKCPEHFLPKVLQALTRAGLVISHRGNTGGFELAISHRNSATVLEIVEAVEGPIHLNSCLASEDECQLQSWCPAYSVWNEAQNALTCVLRRANIADLARAHEEQGTDVVDAGSSGIESTEPNPEGSRRP
jgi:Rrf2 family protein